MHRYSIHTLRTYIRTYIQRLTYIVKCTVKTYMYMYCIFTYIMKSQFLDICTYRNAHFYSTKQQQTKQVNTYVHMYVHTCMRMKSRLILMISCGTTILLTSPWHWEMVSVCPQCRGQTRPPLPHSDTLLPPPESYQPGRLHSPGTQALGREHNLYLLTYVTK